MASRKRKYFNRFKYAKYHSEMSICFTKSKAFYVQVGFNCETTFRLLKGLLGSFNMTILKFW